MPTSPAPRRAGPSPMQAPQALCRMVAPDARSDSRVPSRSACSAMRTDAGATKKRTPIGNPPAADDARHHAQVIQLRARAGADVGLIDGGAGMGIHRCAVLGAVGCRDLGCEARGIDGDFSRHRGLRVTLPLVGVIHVDADAGEPVTGGVVGGDDAALGTQLHRHVGKHHAFIHGHGRNATAGVLGSHVAGAVDADFAAEKQNHVLGRDPVAENSVHPHAQGFGYAHPGAAGGENPRHVRCAQAGHEAAEGPAGG